MFGRSIPAASLKPLHLPWTTKDLVTDEIVNKAVIARGSDASNEGIGKAMRRALEAVAQDIVNRYYEVEYRNRQIGPNR